MERSIEDAPTYDAMIMEPGYERNGDIQDLVECLEWVEDLMDVDPVYWASLFIPL